MDIPPFCNIIAQGGEKSQWQKRVSGAEGMRRETYFSLCISIKNIDTFQRKL
jgi:hypothetical protein